MSYCNVGKQVLKDRQHIADAVDTDTALMIAEALNRTPDYDRHPDMFSTHPTATHAVRQENDEYACSCGRRWDVHDGEDHP